MSYIPFFLTGTDNKYFDYTDGHILEMLNYFMSTIFSADNLFISGYSFCDSGINNIIRHVQCYSKLKVYIISKTLHQTYIQYEDPNINNTMKYIEEFKLNDLIKLTSLT